VDVLYCSGRVCISDFVDSHRCNLQLVYNFSDTYHGSYLGRYTCYYLRCTLLLLQDTQGEYTEGVIRNHWYSLLIFIIFNTFHCSIEQCSAGEFLLYAYSIPMVILPMAQALWCVHIHFIHNKGTFPYAFCYHSRKITFILRFLKFLTFSK
jgi:hypothetical protein